MSLATVDRYDCHRVQKAGGHAVVIGGSVAGLLAARVLADAFDRVTILDRDSLDTGTEARRGVPQGKHTHVLLVAGQVIMEDLSPGLADDLVASGALVLDVSREFSLYAADGFLASGSGGMPMYFASRPVLERLLRAHVADHDEVALWSGCQVTDYLTTGPGGAVKGVLARHDGSQRMVDAELVVDATGRGSRTGTWLEQRGYGTPPTETVHVDLAYRTCQVKRPLQDRRAMLIMPSPPRARGATLDPVEDDRWFVTLFGVHGDHPPGDLDGLREFAAGLPSPVVREVLEHHELATPDIAHYRFPNQTRRRYDRFKTHPRGLLCVGDAVASFNPIYGQGMSVAALEALALHHTLADHGSENLVPHFFARAGKIVEGAWMLSAGGDFQFPQTRGPKPPGTDLVNRYVKRLHRKAQTDGALADAFSRVVVMQQPPTALFRPQVAWRMLRPTGSNARRRRYPMR